MPTNIKPTWAMEENARNLLKLSCRIANRFPIIMVSKDKMNKMLYHVSAIGRKTVYKTETKTKRTAPFDITDKKEVTAMGAPS
jgi:hypothetical protein